MFLETTISFELFTSGVGGAYVLLPKLGATLFATAAFLGFAEETRTRDVRKVNRFARENLSVPC